MRDSGTQSSTMQPAIQHQNTTAVIASGGAQPAPIIVTQQPYNPFAVKASATKKLGLFTFFTLRI